MATFTPWASLFGGVLIGLSAAALLLFNGRPAGISGVVGGLISPQRGEWLWRLAFALGLVAGGVAVFALSPGSLRIEAHRPVLVVALAGALVGFGTRLGGGCTSGHGVCGIGRLSPRSAAATAVFMASGVVTVFVVEHLLGGVP